MSMKMALTASNGSVKPRQLDHDAEVDDNDRASVSHQNEEEEIQSEEDDEDEDEEEEDEDEEEDQDEDEDEEEDEDEDEDARIVKPLSRKDLESYDAKQRKRGIIYISRIPYGMTVPKVRHLLGGFGEVDRIFLQDGREKEAGPSAARKHRSAHFTEGWVEFKDKRVAKAVAGMLNAEPIGAASGGAGGGKGGKRAGGRALRRWKDEVWTMKYLSGFKWGMLSEQLTNERAARASRVRAQLSQSAYEQKDYLRKVERARIQREKESRRQAKEAKQPETVAAARATDVGREHTFRQREAITRDVREQRAKRPLPSSTDDERPKRPKSTADEHRRQALQGALTKIF